jgi:hypothetical protein
MAKEKKRDNRLSLLSLLQSLTNEGYFVSVFFPISLAALALDGALTMLTLLAFILPSFSV